MKHLGDIREISGWEAPVVDCIIGGSPCQDLSVAGRRAGLSGERSGLFMEQIRIIKEMRARDRAAGRTGNMVRPRFMVWENVPGTFSSNKGQDFQAVLTEIIRIAAPDSPEVPLPPKGKWPLADAHYGDGWSVAYRVLNAQFWGVPQRRRRIALVADFGGHAAPEILFVRESVCGDTAPGGAARKSITRGVEDSIGSEVALRMRAGCEGGAEITMDDAPTLNCNHEQRIVAHTLRAQAKDPFAADLATYPVTGGCVRRLTPTECELLQGYPRGWTDIGPWTDSAGKLHKESSDSARYKALGNSIALPPWKWVLKRLCAWYERDATMASLFDGISGFCLIWAKLNGADNVKWCSEIEEFPIAVCKKHFGDERTGDKGDLGEILFR